MRHIKIDIDLNDYEDEILKYFEKNHNYIQEDEVSLDMFSEHDILDYLEENYNTIFKKLYYPNNSLRISLAYEKLLNNVEKIPIEKIEELIKDF